MAKFAALLISLVAGFITVQGLRFDPPNLSRGGKFFSSGVRVAQNDPRCQEDGWFANPDDCTSYYVCKDGASQERHCPEGFKFDSIRHCTLDNDADCGKPDSQQSPSDREVTCPEDYGYFPDPNDCHKYITCTNGKPRIDICPDQTYYINNVGCSFTPGRCPSESSSTSNVCKSPNEMYPVQGQCRKYIQCKNGHPTMKDCPFGKGFDYVKKMCVDFEKARCRSNEIHEILN